MVRDEVHQRHVRCPVSGADVGMDQRRPAGKAPAEVRQGFGEVAEHAERGRGSQLGLAEKPAVKCVDVAAGQAFAEVIESASLAESQLHDDSIQAFDKLDRAIEGRLLGQEPVGEILQTTHDDPGA